MRARSIYEINCNYIIPYFYYELLYLFVCLFVYCVRFGQINSFGIYFTHYKDKMFPNESTSILAAIGSLQSALLFIPGLFAGHVIGKFGPRVLYTIHYINYLNLKPRLE